MPQDQASIQIDERCKFKIDDDRLWVVFSVDEVSKFSLEENIKSGYNPTYGYMDTYVTYFPEKHRALAYGSNFELIYLLDFDRCSTEQLITGLDLTGSQNYTFNDEYFVQKYLGISPDGQYIVFEIFEWSVAPHFPGTEKNYSQLDASLVGYWLKNMETDKLTHLSKKDFGESNLLWKANYSLEITGEACPGKEKCVYDL